MSKIFLKNNKVIEDYTKPYIIAEVNSSHNGDLEVAKRMIDAAVDTGCDCVKFQSWSSSSLYSKSYYLKNPIAKRFVDKLSLTPNELKEAADYCLEKGIDFSSTPYSEEEVDFLVDECKAPFVKISSMEVNNPEYIKYIAKKQIPIVISTGMADFDEVKKAVNIIESVGNKQIAILHCVTIYPTPLDKANVNNLLTLRKMFPNYPIGFSDHTLGDTAAIVACSLGAAVLEKHITLDSTKIGMDNQMAMEPAPLKIYVEKCKGVPSVLGSFDRIIQPEEYKQRTNMRRSVVTKHSMKKGDIIQLTDLDVKRPGTGYPPDRIKDLVGKRLSVDVDEDMVILEEYIEK